MQINQLRYMVAAAKCGSFSAAANELYITQPTLSQQIKVLEEEIGTPLFFRHSKSVSLSDAGKEFYDYASRVLNDTEQVMYNMKSYQTLEKGQVTLGLLWIFSHLNLSEPIQRFNQSHPMIDLHLRLGGSNDLIAMIKRHEIEVAICICSNQMLRDTDLYYRLIQTDTIAVMVHNLNPLSKKEFLTIHDIAGQNVIFPASNTPLHDTLLSLVIQENIQFHVLCDSSHNDINAQIVSQNFAISFSSVSVAEELNTGVYTIVPFYPEIKRSVYLVTPKYQLANPAISELIGYF